jgi:eukaryotic-like serine/threonine-protein kinase
MSAIREDEGALRTTVEAEIHEDASAPTSGEVRTEERYEPRELLGEGGMGRVRLCHDRRFGRDVAMKVLRHPTTPAQGFQTRFLREACVQARLEHPAIPPAYDLGRDLSGNLYFTMKRLRGLTLAELIERMRSADEVVLERRSLHKLLSAFLDVCQGVHFAHAHGVVHRDLKPANIMLGDFGEVYVLDWGIAKVMGDEDVEPGLDGAPAPAPHPISGARTVAGAVLGTPGYMAPEQVLGHVDEIDARTDVYALGAIFFELLALSPLHRGRSDWALMKSVLKGVDARPSLRAPERGIAPELDAICTRATARSKEVRFATARELHDAVEHFLAGDRDLARRRELASSHAATAARAAETALGDAATMEARTMAIREVGRALALDPTSALAMTTMARLLAHPPREVPPEVEARRARDAAEIHRKALRAAAYAAASWYLFIPLAAQMGMRLGWVPFLLGNGAWAVLTAILFRQSREGQVSRHFTMTICVAMLAVASSSMLLGPFIVQPAVATVVTMGALVVLERKYHARVVAFGVLSILLPALLQIAGVLPRSYSFENGTMRVHPILLNLPETPTLLLLGAASVSSVLVGASIALYFRRLLDAAERRLAVQSWQLRQLAPTQRREGSIPEART